MNRQRQTNLFLVGRDQDRCALIAETFADEYPDIRLWRFRCIVDAGGALLRCRPSAIPDAVLLADPLDAWTGMRLRECVCARRELVAVPVFAPERQGGPALRGMGAQWQPVPEPDAPARAAACVRRVAREITGIGYDNNVHPMRRTGDVADAVAASVLHR